MTKAWETVNAEGKAGLSARRERDELEARIDEILELTFPASDPPAWPSVRKPDEPGGG